MQETQTTEPAKSKKRIPLANVAFLLVAVALIGQLIGFLRTKLVNGNWDSHTTDAYFAAFNIPDFFFYTIAAGVLGVVLIPALADRFQKGDRKGMWDLCSSLLNLLCLVMLAVGVIILLFAEPLIHHIVGPKLAGQDLENAVTIMRFLAFNPLLFTISGILTSAQQTLGRFFFFAIAPIFYNLAIIGSIYMFRGTEFGLKGLGVGAFVGAVLQLGVVCFGLIGTKFSWRPTINWRSADLRTVTRQLPPRALDQGMDQIQSIVETNLANRLAPGTVSHYNNAYILQTAPVLLIGTAISTAAFPRLAARLSQGRPDLFRSDFLRILRFMIWITIPVVVVCYLARGYLARLIFSEGSQEIALIFGLLTVAIFFRTMYTIISRWFYAKKDSKTPLLVSVFTISLSITLAIILAQPKTYGASGLALSVSISAMAEVLILGTIMVIRDRGLLNWAFWGGVIRIISVCGFSMVAGYVAVSFLPLGANDIGIVTLGAKLAMITGAIFLTHIAISGLFGLDEVRPIFTWIKRLILRPIRGAY